jgi:glycosyltransferase involved in cell wall biosynthesis
LVEFKSGISNQELVEEYAAASLAIVPSLYEGFGLPAAEAMAAGVPLICSDGGALPEVVGAAAQLVKAGSVEELHHALCELLGNDELRQVLAARGRAHSLQQLSWDCVGKQLEQYYRRLLNQPEAMPKEEQNENSLVTGETEIC